MAASKFLVTYDLVGTSETSSDYTKLIETIKSFPSWGKIQKSVWLVKTNLSATEVRDALSARMDGDDRLMVIGVTGTAAWRNVICDAEWLRRYLRG